MNPKRDLTAYYLAAVFGLSLIGGGGLVALEIFRPDFDRGLIVQLFGFLAPTLVALLALLRGEANGAALKTVESKLDTNTDLTRLAADVDDPDECDDLPAPPLNPLPPLRDLPGGFD